MCPEGACLTGLGVPSLVGDALDGVQQALLVAVRVELELRPGVVAELGDGHLEGAEPRPPASPTVITVTCYLVTRYCNPTTSCQ